MRHLCHLRQGAPKKRYNSFLFNLKDPAFSLCVRADRGKYSPGGRSGREAGRIRTHRQQPRLRSYLDLLRPESQLCLPFWASQAATCLQFKSFFRRRLRLKKYCCCGSERQRQTSPRYRSRVLSPSALEDVLPSTSQGLLVFSWVIEARPQVFVGDGLFCRQ